MPAPLVVAAGSAIVSMLGPFIERLIGLIPDPEAKAQAAREWAELAVTVAEKSDTQQIELLKLDADKGFYQAGWRPAAAWICVVGLAMHSVGYPLLGWYLSLTSPGTSLPQFDTDLLVNGLLIPLLGLAGYRTVERIGGGRK